jgi:hypothetical protein
LRRRERERPVVDEARRPRVAHEHRGDDELELVGQAQGQQLGQNPTAALDHEPPDAAAAQVVEHPGQVDGGSGVHHGRRPGQSPLEKWHRRRRGEDHRPRTGFGEDPRTRVEVS